MSTTDVRDELTCILARFDSVVVVDVDVATFLSPANSRSTVETTVVSLTVGRAY